MEVKLRKIGNALGVILPKSVVEQADFHTGETLDINIDENGVSLSKHDEDLNERILKGIIASDNENVDFSNSFNDEESESW